MSKKFYSIKKISVQNGGNIGRVDIYGDIDRTQFWGDEITPSTFSQDLNSIGVVNEIECHIFSNGGDMFASLAIYGILRSRPEKVTVYIEGIAASGGSIIACAGDVVYMPITSMIFVHNLVSDIYGANEHDLREALAEYEQIKEPMINAYMNKSGRTHEEVIALMDGDNKHGSWLSAEKAIEFGLADDYTPEKKLPLEAAACLSPGIFNYSGHTIDLTCFNEAAEKTARIINFKRGGNSMAFFNKKKNKKAAAKVKPKAEITFVETACPHCDGSVNLNPETGEVYAAEAQQTEPQKGNANADTSKKVFAKLMSGNVRTKLYTIECPHCGEEYIWDTDTNVDGEVGTQTTEASPLGGKPSKTPEKKQAADSEPTAELAEASCPNCGALVQYDTETAETEIDEAGTEGYLLTCSECDTEFVEPIIAASPTAIPAGASAQAAYRIGVQAERNRMLALDEMAQAAPV
jgi:ATP-dependent protease ClpP protease subunit/predicted RNA-binding Zn-ribbon protein involved in translation (DUF1610 family)